MRRRSIARVATDKGLNVVQLIRAAKHCKTGNWLTSEDEGRLVSTVETIYSLTDVEMQQVERYLRTDPRAQELLAQYADLVPLMSFTEAAGLLGNFCRRMMKDMNLPCNERCTPEYLQQAVLNLGLIEARRSGGSDRSLVDVVERSVISYDADLGRRLLTRHWLQQIQVKTLEEARGYMNEQKERWQHGHS